MKSITTDRVIVSRLVAKVVRVALSVACMAIITCQGISALKASTGTGSRWASEYRHSLKLQRVAAIKLGLVAVELWLTKRAILTTFATGLRNQSSVKLNRSKILL